MMLQADLLFADRYRLIKCIGRGGFAEVWLAEDTLADLQVAIKIYGGMDDDGLKIFVKEINKVYHLNHTNLLKPQHVDAWENMPFLIMAYCPAGSCVKRVGKMTEEELWKLIHDVAAGLAYLHEKDVIHQDIKPDNILVDTEGNYLITDFGISTRARSTLRKSVIGGNTSGGTTAYMGPERFSRQPAPTKASDIWSFGAMAFELLEGVVPFGEIGGGLQKGGAEIPFINADVSDELKFTIFKMLSKETWDRPTAATLIEWANDPSKIDVDYDLLTEESSADQPQPAPYIPAIEEVTTGRETQRFGAPSATNDTNATVAFGTAASEELTISVNPAEINVPAEGGNAIVYVNTNGEWTLPKATTQDWIRTTKYSDSAFTVKFDKNKTGKERAYTLVVPAANNGNKAFANIAIKQPSVKSKAWIWWLLLPIIVIISVVGISNYNERKQYEEQQRQEQVRRNNIQSTYDRYKNQINTLVSKGGVKDVNALITARGYVKDMQNIEQQNYWINAMSSTYSQTVEAKCQETYNELIELGNKWADKYNKGQAKFNDVNDHVYDYFDNAYKLYPSDDLKKVRDSWSSTNTPIHYGHEYVDLGLSVKWATYNLGASTPEHYGNYYAWGETQPQSSREYSWNTYRYSNGTYYSMTKYCTNREYGKVDNKSKLDMSDDAARVNWGGNWRMPTYSELQELVKECRWTWTSQNGVNGYKVVSKKNGKSIFLPAAGYNKGYQERNNGWYWSKSLRIDYQCGAWNLWFTQTEVSTHGLSGSAFRCNGYSIRPVCP